MKIIAKNTAITQTIEDVISKGGVLTDPTQARVHALVSNDANDNATGTGARTVQVQGVTEKGIPEIELVTLNGLTPVNTLNKYFWLQLEVISAGTGGKNAGTITATAATDSTISCQIEVGKNISEQAVYMMPRDTYGLIRFFSVKASNSTAGAVTNVEIWIKEHGQVWVPGFSISLDANNPEFVDINSGIIPKIKPLAMVKVCAVATDGTSSVTVNFDIAQE